MSERSADFDVTMRPKPRAHQLLGSVCSCGGWWAQCGNDVSEQWRQHVNASELPSSRPGSTTAGGDPS